MGLWIAIGVVVILALFLIYTYNSLVKLSVWVDEAWSQIDVQLKRRYKVAQKSVWRQILSLPEL